MGKYQYMNLEQKLAKIRKKMPVLLKNIIKIPGVFRAMPIGPERKWLIIAGRVSISIARLIFS